MTAHRALTPQTGPIHPFSGPGAQPECELSVVMPCLNEAETLRICIDKALGFMERAGVVGEVVIADNGSTDGSQAIAREAGARVVDVERRGYGAALLGGIEAARGEFVVMGDCDDSYDFSALDNYLERLREGDELVMGNRFKGGVQKGAMPRLHRYFGNPFLTWAGRTLFGSPVGDFQCGLRGFSREAMSGVGLRAEGMEFASEMVMKSTLHGLRIGEVPTTLVPDGRSRPPHMRSWRDGWRNLRLLLMHSPRWLFSVPGTVLLFTGIALMAAVLLGPARLSGLNLGTTALVIGSGLFILGSQVLSYGSIMRRIGRREGHLPPAKTPESRWTIERTLTLGMILCVAGVGGLIWGLKLETINPLHLTLSCMTAVVVGVQVALFGFVNQFLGLRRTSDD